MYEINRSRPYNGLGNFGQGPYDPYPGYSTDPAQVPIAPGYPYGIPGVGYPGYAFGQRILEMPDAIRLAKERQIAMEQRAEISSLPEHKYLSPGRKLSPAQQGLFDSIKAKQEAGLQKSLESSLESKISRAVFVGILLSALLRS